ncbi:hypothetical protein HYDPIDRAFT_116987 [Hydnomerulius pinastri MD-312]|uniref:Uncharacterized protein n=1 Tax=Hydnomerulius pinastri MD-312 TaxID=994086 RepID=A0A0C9VYN2_9AGAM|nr:hypothetical protein HYDPIDRAFT_119476 [Hydnomerulius pinastri MD-312]KIJ60498.1 hypothetical protein HYDPIDRAFT_116987 [Hydnomerulius pinastri MD-312]
MGSTFVMASNAGSRRSTINCVIVTAVIASVCCMKFAAVSVSRVKIDRDARLQEDRQEGRCRNTTERPDVQNHNHRLIYRVALIVFRSALAAFATTP